LEVFIQDSIAQYNNISKRMLQMVFAYLSVPFITSFRNGWMHNHGFSLLNQRHPATTTPPPPPPGC